MASMEGLSSITEVVKLPSESTSRSFTDCKPGVIKYDVKHIHVWNIGNISQKMEMETGTRVESGVFSIKIRDQIVDWRLSMDPNGHPDRDGSIGYIGIYLEKITDTEFCLNEGQFKITFMDKNGLNSYDIYNRGYNSYNYERTETLNFDGWAADARGWSQVISHSQLRNSPNLIPNDTLTVRCEITVTGGGLSLVGGGPSSMTGDNEETSTRKCLEDMGNVLAAGKFSDVTISCQEKQFPCHKAILAGRSTVFAAMFTHKMKESLENNVKLVDIDVDTLEEMLFFIYNGKVKNLKENAVNLLAAGEKYDLKELKQSCEESISVNLRVENVLDMLVTAYIHDASYLKALAMKFIGENARAVAAQKEWREKMRMYPDLMADVMDVFIQK